MKPRAMDLDGTLQPPTLVGVMVLLDRSGSMRGIRPAMEDAFAQFVAAQKALPGADLWLTLHQFDDEGYDVTYDRVPLADVGSLHLVPRGNTPLRDSLYRFATAAKAVIDDPADQTERLLLVVVTDGQENASTQHTWSQVRAKLGEVEGPDCEVIFMGTSAAVLEAEDQLATFKQAGGTVAWQPTAQGVGYAAGGMVAAVSAMKLGHSARGITRSYLSATDGGEHVMSQAELLRWAQEQAKAQAAKVPAAPDDELKET
jgi:hypothetical protein